MNNGQQVLVDDLRTQIRKKRAVFVVGTGISLAATCGEKVASWPGLLESGIDRCVALGSNNLPCDWADVAKRELSMRDIDSLLSVASKVEAKLQRYSGEFQRWLSDTVGLLKVKNSSVITGLYDLDAPIITTNYDGLLEDESGLDPITWRDTTLVEQVLRGDRPGIIHAHGYYEDADSIILGIRSYEQIQHAEHFQTMLRAMRAMDTLVYVGCGAGLEDPNFGTFLNWSAQVFKKSVYRSFRLVSSREHDHLMEERAVNGGPIPIEYGEFADLPVFLSSLRIVSEEEPEEGEKPRGAIATTSVVAITAQTAEDHTPEKDGGSEGLIEDHVDIKIDRDYDSFSDVEQRKLLQAIWELLGLTGNVRVVLKRRGCVVLRLATTNHNVGQIIGACRTGQLESLDILRASRVIDCGQEPFAQKYHAFLAFDSADRDEAEWIHDQLELRGLRVAIEQKCIYSSDRLEDKIIEGIHTSETAVVLLGKRGLDNWKNNELSQLHALARAGTLQKIIPVLLPGVERPPEGLCVLSRRCIRLGNGVSEHEVLDILERAITGQEPRSNRWPFEIHVSVKNCGAGCLVVSSSDAQSGHCEIIEDAVRGAGIEVLQFQDSHHPGFEIAPATAIRSARLVIVDYARNAFFPEVVYVLGYANALGKPTIVLTEQEIPLPRAICPGRVFRYEDAELTSGSFNKRLIREILDIMEAEAYPYLTDPNLPEVYAISSKLASGRLTLWRTLQTIMLWGLRVHNVFYEIAKHAHKLKHDITRVEKDLHEWRQRDNRELHLRNRRAFETAYQEDYLRVHQLAEEINLQLKSGESEAVSKSFDHLAASVGRDLDELVGRSHGFFEWACSSITTYFDIHDQLMHQVSKIQPEEKLPAASLRVLCGGLAEQVNAINMHVNDMMVTLWEVIAREHKLGGNPNVIAYSDASTRGDRG